MKEALEKLRVNRNVSMPNINRANSMQDKLFWRLRDRMFNLNKKGECFPSQVAELVVKNCPKGLIYFYPYKIVETVKSLAEVVDVEFDLNDCTDAVENELGVGPLFIRIN